MNQSPQIPPIEYQPTRAVAPRHRRVWHDLISRCGHGRSEEAERRAGGGGRGRGGGTIWGV